MFANIVLLSSSLIPYISTFTGWRETLTTLPKKLLSGVSFSSEAEPQDVTLPKLPVPLLEDTLAKYLEAVEPLVSDTQLESTKAIVRDFGSATGLGPKLQAALLERQEQKDNWAYEWWLNDMYLDVKLPLPVNSNPGAVFPPQQFSQLRELARYGACMIDALVSHKEVLDRKGLPVEKAASREKGQPLCMSQYYRILTSYRIPAAPRDQLFSTIYQGDGTSEHVIVIYKNQLFSLVVKSLDPSGNPLRLTIPQITQELVKILEAPRTTRATPIGLLTGQKRDIWAGVRDLLRQECQNADNLETIEKSLAILCIDDPLPESFNLACPRAEKPAPAGAFRSGERDETSMLHQMLHGGGSLYNAGNRWFDKTIQLIISKDGVSGLCYEHSPAEGVAAIDLTELLLEKNRTLRPDNEQAEVEIPQGMEGRKMEWVITAEVQKGIHEAARTIDNLAEDLDLYVYRYTKYGKENIKSFKCSPDAYIQMALQLAYFKLYGSLVATYESASTRRFQLGRVDCIRSATIETLAWVQAMAEELDQDTGKRVSFSELDDKRKRELFDAAMGKQTKIMVDNILGQGIDIHLLGLREMAKEMTGGVPAIFLDETYSTSIHFTLSTSQVSTKTEQFMGYGPVVPDGYGASYNPRSDQIIFCISAWHSCARTSAWRFARSLEEALDSMSQLLSGRESQVK